MANSAFDPVSGSLPYPTTGVRAPTSTCDEQVLGLRAIYNTCRALYPDQPTPLQVTAVRKYWMGGPDPLDFINMYSNPGSPCGDSPPHWHYVTNGLSDLYGDSRLHYQCSSTEDPSGFGFELTLRIRREPTEVSPPTWPAHLLQSLARYVFHSQAQLMAGDHIPWPSPLDQQPVRDVDPLSNNNSHASEKSTNAHSIAMAAAATAASVLAGSKAFDSQTAMLSNPSTYASMFAAALAAVNRTSTDDRPKGVDARGTDVSPESTSRIRHMLIVEDPQLKKISTPYGYVQFLQLVGLCDEELRLVQRWTGNHVMNLMSRLPETGGRLLVTDMRRSASLFELEPNLSEFVDEHLRREGSNLSGVTTQYFAWAPISLTMLSELLPGETEAQKLRSLTKQLECTPSIGGAIAQPVHTFTDQKNSNNDLRISENVSLPTDLSFHHGSDSLPVAMETDDATVLASTKKDMDEDDFIDVVGDSGPSSVCNQPNSGNISKDDATMTVQSVATHPIDRGSSNQSASAPGGFSAWCARLGSGKSVPADNGKTDGSPSVKSTSNRGSRSTLTNLNGDLTCPTTGSLGFRAFNTDSVLRPDELKGMHTPGSTGEGSAPCTPLAHLSLSPASLDLLPTRVIDCLDIHLCREAAEILPLAVNGRLRHGRHFTLLNANFPDHAITLVPNNVSGAFVSQQTPYVSRGPWLQVLLPDDFLDRLEVQFSVLTCLTETALPIVFRWPERRLRISIVHPTQYKVTTAVPSGASDILTSQAHSLLPKAVHMNSVDQNQRMPTKDQFDLASPSATHVGSPRDASSKSSANDHPHRLTSHAFPFFPPGCVPPPAVLAALFNSGATSQIQPSRTNAPHGLNSPPSSVSARAGQDPSANIDPALKTWLHTFASRAMDSHESATFPPNATNPWLHMSEFMQAAVAAVQQSHLNGNSVYPITSRSGINPTP